MTDELPFSHFEPAIDLSRVQLVEPFVAPLSVEFQIAPRRTQAFKLTPTRERIRQVVEWQYHLGGREALRALPVVIATLHNDYLRGEEEMRRRAETLANEEIGRLDDQIRDTLVKVDQVARPVFSEMLDQAKAGLRLANAGLIDDEGATAYPPINRRESGDETFKKLRTWVVSLDKLARELARAENLASFELPRRNFLGGYYPEIYPIDLRQDANERENLRRQELQREFQEAASNRQRDFLSLFRKGAAAFPVLAVMHRKVLAELSTWRAEEVEELASQEGNYDNRLDMLIREQVTAAHRAGISGRSSLWKKYMQMSDKAIRIMRDSTLAPEFVMARYHPLWRYPMIIQVALERLQAATGTVAHTAAINALWRAEELAEQEAKEREESETTLFWAMLGFGVLELIPVLNLFATAAGIIISEVLVLQSAASYMDEQERYNAFGVLAGPIGIPEPEGVGLLTSALGAAAGLLPLSRPLLRQTGSLMRITGWSSQLEETLVTGLLEFDLNLTLNGISASLEADIRRERRIP